MKKLIKIALLVLVVAIFTFSDNATVTKLRTGVVNKATELLKKGDKAYDDKEAEIIKNVEEKFGENGTFKGGK